MLCTYTSVAMVIGRASCCFTSPKELYDNDGPLESSPEAKNDAKNLQISEQVVCRTSLSLVVIKKILQRFDEKWLIWGRNVESELLLETLNSLSLNSSEPQFPHLEYENHYNKLVEASKIK